MKTIGVDLHKDSKAPVAPDEQAGVIRRDSLPTKCRNQTREWFV